MSAVHDQSEGGGTPVRRGDGTGWWVFAVVLAAAALVLGLVGVLMARDDTAATGASGSGSGAASGGGATEYDVSLGEFFVQPASIAVPAGETITLHVTNDGTMAHDLKVDGTDGTEMLAPGDSATVEIGPFDASAQAWCTVPGHKEAGMVMQVEVAGSSGADGTGAAAAFATIDPQAEPTDGWTPRDPTAPLTAAGQVHNIELHATEELIEVAPGVTQMMWTFDGSVPGPVFRGNVGDTFRFTLYNDGTLGHSIDFHASKVAWNDEMRTINPGESLVYEYTATSSGIYMYHCGTGPALHHIGNGMYGAIIIDPPDLAAVDHEYVLVQSELYLGPEGGVGDYDKMFAEEFDAVVFNGYWNQYKFAPIEVGVDESVRVWVLDAGPSENSAFHVVGTIFDTVYKEGAILLEPGPERGGSQVMDLQPAQGGFVEMTFAEDGLYPIVTHKFANVGKGALGLFKVGTGGAAAAGGH